jgi:hypothetical protein
MFDNTSLAYSCSFDIFLFAMFSFAACSFAMFPFAAYPFAMFSFAACSFAMFSFAACSFVMFAACSCLLGRISVDPLICMWHNVRGTLGDPCT